MHHEKCLVLYVLTVLFIDYSTFTQQTLTQSDSETKFQNTQKAKRHDLVVIKMWSQFSD